MYKKKRWICVAWLLVMMLLLCACGNLETGKNQGEVAENDKIQIGMSFDSFVIERWQRDRDIFVSTAKELGAEVNVQNANGDLEQQKKQINYFIDKGMDVIVVICIDSKGLTEEVQRAKDAGIKIIAYDRLLQNTDIDLYISFDNERVGTMMGEALLENGLAGGNVLMLGGSAVDSNVAMVEKGFRKVMEDNQVTILDSMHADGWKAELAGAYIYEHMDVVSEADAIMCGNDDLASKVVHALKEKRLAGDIMVVGQDADLEACQRIVEGTQVMTAAHPAKIVPEKLRFQHSVVRIIEKCEAAASQSLFRIPPSLSAGFGKVIGCYFRKQCRILAVVAGGKTANRLPISLQRDRGCPFRQKCRHGVIVESVITPLDAVGEVSCDEHLRSRGFLRENRRRDLLQQQAVLFQTVPQKIDVAVLPAIGVCHVRCSSQFPAARVPAGRRLPWRNACSRRSHDRRTGGWGVRQSVPDAGGAGSGPFLPWRCCPRAGTPPVLPADPAVG